MDADAEPGHDAGPLRQVNIYEAKTTLSRLIDDALAHGEITIARNGRPVARLAPLVAHTNIHDAKAKLSRLVDQVADGGEIVIGRNGRPVARLLPLARVAPGEPGPAAVIASCGHFTITATTVGQ